jgi:hypothetical protein
MIAPTSPPDVSGIAVLGLARVGDHFWAWDKYLGRSLHQVEMIEIMNAFV